MGQELTQANETLLEFERLIQSGGCNAWEGTLRTGVDLGTANIVLAVVDEQNRPVAGASYPSTVVRDGIVVDYMGAVRAVTHLKGQLEERLGVMLDAGACAIPPGILEGNVKAIGNVVEAAGFRLTNIVDEPTAASSVLGISDGAVVDVGGACCFTQFESVFEKFLGVPVVKPAAPLLVTPLGIAVNCKL